MTPLGRFAAFLAALTFTTAARAAAPGVSNLTATQRTGTKLVDITYDVTADTPTVIVSLEISSDGGTTSRKRKHSAHAVVLAVIFQAFRDGDGNERTDQG